MEPMSLLRVLMAFAFVVGLMLTIAWLVKRLGLEKRWRHAAGGGSGLMLEDSLYLDNQRRVVLVGHGTRKHLLLLGAQSDRVIESYDAPNENAEAVLNAMASNTKEGEPS